LAEPEKRQRAVRPRYNVLSAQSPDLEALPQRELLSLLLPHRRCLKEEKPTPIWTLGTKMKAYREGENTK
jgi:hypothetical protein